MVLEKGTVGAIGAFYPSGPGGSLSSHHRRTLDLVLQNDHASLKITSSQRELFDYTTSMIKNRDPLDLGFSHTLHVLKERRRRCEHPHIREKGSPVPAGPQIFDDADTGAGGPRRSRSPDSQRQARIPSAENTLRRVHQRTSAGVCPSTPPPSLPRRTPPRAMPVTRQADTASRHSHPTYSQACPEQKA